MNLKTAIELLKSNDPKYKRLTAGYGDDFDFLPTKKFFLPVDSSVVVSSGTVKPENARRIVSRMDIDLSKKNYLGKQEIVILDMLQHNNWKRPIYFAVTVGDDSYLGLRDYFQLEGLAFRVVPTRGANQVNTEAMYENMMHKFKWGGIENPKVYLDENNLRMTTTLRHMFSRLAGALIAEGKKDKALEVLDYCMKVIPGKTIPHTYVSVVLASQYYQLEQKEKAEAILDEILTNSLQYLKWFSTLNQNQLRSAASDFGQHLGIVSEVLQISQNYGNEELVDKNYPLFLEYSKTYNSLK
jgi:hypothetical protein